ncbi:MAG: zinc ribbon domain-containing protein [Pirellulales bacterium]|nr:zinc ribbon domain-containing protein [Pirellulales bacterium]
MPLYEYACRGCGRRFEYLVRADDPARCPDCGGSDLEKLMSAASGHVAGSSASSCPARDVGDCSTCQCPGSCRMAGPG